jgi:NAD(P)-dependent dehydrogenase (short-subunit alcohol dehydrogenase family)
MNIHNKVALITGGSRGLGRNMALQLARNGADVVITYRSKKTEAESVCAEIQDLGRKAVCLPLDTGIIASFPEFTSKLDTVLKEVWNRTDCDFLINNAGIDVHSPFGHTTEEQFDSLFNVHFKGVYFLTQAMLTRLADGGRIVCVSTGLTRFAIPGYAPYASTKGAIEVFVKYLAKELGSRRITANAIAPGAIETDFNKEAFEHNPQMQGFIASQTALGRVGHPDDIGGLVAFLCSEEGGWVNAQRIEASGGMFL